MYALFDDQFPDHPKVTALSDGAFRLHTSGIIYCARYLTDGLIPKGVVGRLTPNYRSEHLKELLRGKDSLWRTEGDHYYIHDYTDWNPSREEVAELKKARSAAGAKGARARWGSGRK